MSDTANLLIEIGTEELPPKSLLMLSNVFRREIENGLKTKELDFSAAHAYATPRRLAVKVSDLVLRSADKTIERRGPALAAAYDADGKPTKAALGFAASCKTDVESLTTLKTSKGEWLSYSAEVAGEETAGLVGELVAGALAALPIPKPMRWGSGSAEFVRPVHWIVLMLDDVTIDATILDINSGRKTRGHRFHSQGEIMLDSAAQYPQILEASAYVIADFAERRERVLKAAYAIAEQQGLRAIIDHDLLDEVTALVEWPVAICGTFDEHFLELPREVLIASMQDHQKYFPVESPDGSLSNRFITISNIDSSEPEAVRRGNERVIRPRLSDAAFFWRQDRKDPLEKRLHRLNGIVFEKRLGSIGDKTNRVVHLSRALAENFAADPEHCARAAVLSRCDLVSDMVGEFPELQGLMGSYYAKHDGEPEVVTSAIRDFYRPRYAGDTIPASAEGRCIAFADKLDSLVGIFAIGAAPTGDKDPYALRRAALGCIRIALESDSSIGFAAALKLASDGYANVVDTDGTSSVVTKFFLDRLRGYYAEQKTPNAVVEAVLAVRPDQPSDIQARIAAVVAFRDLAESGTLAAANKRIANILKKNPLRAAITFDPALLQDDAELALNDAIAKLDEALKACIEKNDHTNYLKQLARLNDPINAFFDEVMVMCDDEALRNNRLKLLSDIHASFTHVADIARLND